MKTCTAPHCNSPVKARMLCAAHYNRFKRHGSFENLGRGMSARKEENELTRKTALEEAKRLYKLAVGLPARLEWARKIRELENA